MSRIDDDHVDAGVNELLDAFFRALADGNGSAREELALRILGGKGVIRCLRDVLHRHEAGEVEVLGDDEHALEAVLVHEFLGFFKGGALMNRDEAFARRHDFADGNAHAGFKAQVAVRDHAENGAVFGNNREAGNAVFAGKRNHVAHEHVGADRDRFGNDAGFVTLHLGDFRSLLVGGHVLVNEADAAFLSEGNRELRFRHRIHGGGNHRNIDRKTAGELRLKLRVAREDFRIGGNEQNVVERVSRLKESHNNL